VLSANTGSDTAESSFREKILKFRSFRDKVRKHVFSIKRFGGICITTEEMIIERIPIAFRVCKGREKNNASITVLPVN
jgi:hypothetical protein